MSFSDHELDAGEKDAGAAEIFEAQHRSPLPRCQSVAAKVSSGRYTSASEVVREALRLLEEHDQARQAQLSTFNEELGKRLQALDQGEGVLPAEARKRLAQKSEALKKRTA